jgi:hypothetical protein
MDFYLLMGDFHIDGGFPMIYFDGKNSYDLPAINMLDCQRLRKRAEQHVHESHSLSWWQTCAMGQPFYVAGPSSTDCSIGICISLIFLIACWRVTPRISRAFSVEV